MALNLREILGRLRTRTGSLKLKRRKALDNAAWTHFPRLRILLLVVGYVWILCLPLKELSRGIYIDENALQPGGVRPINFHSPLSFLTHVCIRYTHTGTGETCIEQIHTSVNWRDCAITMRPAPSEWQLLRGNSSHSSFPDVQNISAPVPKTTDILLCSKLQLPHKTRRTFLLPSVIKTGSATHASQFPEVMPTPSYLHQDTREQKQPL
jgi:hypothetical protein